MPSYMVSLDLSDISDYEDYMTMSSDEDIPGMENVPYWYRTLVCFNIIYLVNSKYQLTWQKRLVQSIPWCILP